MCGCAKAFQTGISAAGGEAGRINHVAVEVGEIEAALAFFEQIFGELRLRGRIGSRMAFVDIGDQFIALAMGPQVLHGMGFAQLAKSESALAEPREKGLTN